MAITNKRKERLKETSSRNSSTKSTEDNELRAGWSPKFVAEATKNELEVMLASRTSITSPGATSDLGYGSELSASLGNIACGVTPFNKHRDGHISVSDAINLCQKAYWNISIFRMTIDIMTEFSNSNIHFYHENKSAVKFFETWYEKIGGWKHRQQFFLEYFRSGNVFFYRVDTNINIGDFRSKYSRLPGGQKIPIKYILLNPSDIVCLSGASFADATYAKVLNPYEMDRLRNPRSEMEKILSDSLPKEIKEKVNSNSSTYSGSGVQMELDKELLTAVFYKKQDYEPLAIPIYFPVLYDLNLKLEFKKVENIIAKTTDYIILLITMGTEEGCREGLYDPLINAMQNLFLSESVGRVLVSDFSTKAEFVLPDLKKILGPEKYEVVNEDIANGLMNIFFGEDKFANSMIKIKLFLERLNEARTAYLECFLKPEMQRIAEELGFANVPNVEFESLDLRDDIEYYKIYNRLAEIGYLTPDETFDAYETHILPKKEDNEVNQEKFLSQKKKGLYEPVAARTKNQLPGENGRPSGTKAPQTTKKVAPMKATQFSVAKIKDTVIEANKLIATMEDMYKKKFKLTRLSKKKKEMVEAMAVQVCSTNKRENWENAAQALLDGSGGLDSKAVEEITEICETHAVDVLVGSILYNSKV